MMAFNSHTTPSEPGKRCRKHSAAVHEDKRVSRWTITLIELQARTRVYFTPLRTALPNNTFAHRWLDALLAEAASNRKRFENRANKCFRDALLGDYACLRSITLDSRYECIHALGENRRVARIECSEYAASRVYAVMRIAVVSDLGSEITMTWDPARLLCIYNTLFATTQVRVRTLLSEHSDPRADVLMDRCSLGYVDAAGWLPSFWPDPYSRISRTVLRVCLTDEVMSKTNRRQQSC